MKLVNFIICFILLVFCNPMLGNKAKILHFNQFSLEEGLTQATVHKILRDNEGFLWIGTSYGLNRFDGQHLTTFISSKKKENSLPGNYIYYIAEDDLKNIWVSTNNGLTLFNKSNQTFEIQKVLGTNMESYSYCLIPDGMICSSSGSLFKYDYKSQNWRQLPLTSKKELAFHFTRVLPWDENKLLLNSRFNGQYLYHIQTGAVTEAPFSVPKNTPTLFIDSNKNIWISVYAAGLYCFSQDGKLIKQYNSENSSLSNDVVLDIVEINGELWIGTDGGGISILNLKDNTFRHINHIFEDLSSFPSNAALTIYNDNWGRIWIGTVRNGIIELKDVFMKTYSRVSFGNHHGLSNKAILALFEDEDGSIWIGTDGGGMNKFSPKTNRFEHFEATVNDKITSITQSSNSELLISVFDQGVFYFNKKTGKKRQLVIVNKEINKRMTTSGFSLTLYSTDGINTQIISDDVYVHNKNTNSFTKIPFPKGQSNSRRILKRIASSRDDQYFFTSSKIYQKQSDKYVEIWSQPNSSVLINAIAEDKQNNLWIATNDGIRSFDTENLTFNDYLTTPSNNVIKSLICDSQNRLWIGTKTDLWVYYINDNHFEVFDQSDGVSTNEYFENSYLITKVGDIYMGGVNGLLYINKNIEPESKTIPNIKLIEVSTKDKNLYQFNVKGKKKLPQIDLNWKESSVTFRILIQEKNIFKPHRIRYYISELYDEPIETNNRFLTLHSLPSGRHTVSVSIDLAQGNWSNATEIFTLNIAPPWWKSSWFYIIETLIIISLIVLTFRYFIKKKENKLKWQLQEREKDISAQKIRFLINVSHELRTPLTLIYSPLGRILKEPLDNKIRSQLVSIYRQASRMKETVNMVLDINKYETEKMKLDIEYHNLHNWIYNIVAQFADEFDYNKINVNYNFDDRINLVPFDSSKCTIVLSNILSNALKFSSEANSIIIGTKLIGNENKIEISVSDKGIGLKEIDIDNLFKRFYQGKHKLGGSGIGLSFSKTIVELHGGEIGAKNNENDIGATFYFNLPLRQTSVSSERKSVQVAEYLDDKCDKLRENSSLSTDSSAEFVLSNYSVLLVEDNPELLKFLKESLCPNFKKIYLAENGKVAIELTKQHLPDIIVSDVVMPEMDGFELCVKLKSDIEISHIPVVLLTARGDSGSIQTGYKLGADAYLSKPFEIDFLRIIIENQLKTREIIKIKYKDQSKTFTPEEITFSNADENFIIKLNELIENNISNNTLNVNFISAEIGMSRSSLYNKLNDLLNMSVNDYINKIKLEKAANKLISDPKMEIAEIAISYGFTSQQYFSTKFKQYKGVSPSKFRENNLSN